MATPAVELLLPRPRQVRPRAGELGLDRRCRIAVSAAAAGAADGLLRSLRAQGLEPSMGGSSSGRGAAQLRLALDVDEPLGPQGYRLSVEPSGVDLVAADAAGLAYGGATLSQWLRLTGRRRGDRWRLPCVEIVDAPDFAARGFMLDVSRNRVPRLDTLFELVELLAGLKFNQLQLYTEHTFAYRGHDAVWQASSPLTERDVRELDAFCRRRFVELVPNQNSFGHFHRWLSHDAYRPLAERPDGVRHPFGRHREPFSLCPLDPGSLRLLDDLFEQLLPNFTSRLVNVGLDETFDLGTGRSAQACAERGKEEVYLDFLREIHALVGAWGRRMQFWGDIILRRPDLIGRLPGDVIALDWGYEADHPFDDEARAFAAAGLDYYVCPGTSSWSSLGGRVDNAVVNLARAAVAGRAQQAAGYLVTDWGDFGHLQPLPISYPGIVAGAAFSWNASRAADPAALPLRELLQTHVPELADASLVSALMALGEAPAETGVELRNTTVLFQLLIRAEETLEHRRFDGLGRRGLERALDRLASIDLPRGAARALVARELDWTARLLELACRLGLERLQAGRGRRLTQVPVAARRALAEPLQSIIDELPELWLARSRPGGLDDSRGYLTRLRELLS